MPRAAAAFRSMDALRGPVEAISFKLGKPLDELAPQRRALAHHADDVIGKQPLGHGVRIGQMVVEYIEMRRAPLTADQSASFSATP